MTKKRKQRRKPAGKSWNTARNAAAPARDARSNATTKSEKRAPVPGFKANRLVFLFAGIFGACVIAFQCIYYWVFLESRLYPVYLDGAGQLAVGILRLLGEDASYFSPTISNSRHIMSIAAGCDGIQAMAVFISAVLATPARWRYRAIGIACGIALLYILNEVRIVSLFLIGLHHREWFETMHLQFWPAFLILMSGIAWVVWAMFLPKPGVKIS